MIKNKLKKLLAIGSIALLGACADPDLSPIVTFDILGKGGYARLVELTAAEYDLNDIANTAFIYEVEFVTEDKGNNVDTYEIQVSFNGGDPTVLSTFGQSDFTDSEGGFKSIAISISLTDAASALSIDPNTLVAGDYFQFDGFVILNNGSRFGFENSTGAVNGTAFQGFMRSRINVTCPLTDTQYVGTYSVAYVDANDAPNCFTGGATLTDNIPDMTLATVSGSTTQRTMSPAGGTIPWALGGFSYSGSPVIEFVCDNVRMTGIFDLNGSCGGEILLTGAAATAIPTDLSDDDSFTLLINEFSNGECGCDEITFELQFTKQ